MAKRHGGLDRETILEASLEILDERGLDGFTLRALGERLGYSTMATYRHFANKEEIVDALADRLLDEIRVDDPDDGSDPDDLIIDYTLRARQILLEHPALVPVIAARPLASTERSDDMVRLFLVFGAAGFPAPMIPESVLTLMSVTVGLILYEQQRAMYEARQADRYRAARTELLAEMVDRAEAPDAAQNLVNMMMTGEWGAKVFESTVRHCYRGLKSDAGIE